MAQDIPVCYLLRAADTSKHVRRFSHSWNPRSLLMGSQLGRMTGLKRTGVNLVRIPSGHESFVYHSRSCEEE